MDNVHAVVFEFTGTLLDVHAGMTTHGTRRRLNRPRISADRRRARLEHSGCRRPEAPGPHGDFHTETPKAGVARHPVRDHAVLADVRVSAPVVDPYLQV